MEKNPLVAIECIVYNHEPFLRECLDGLVNQKTNFPFFIVAHDDKSTDKSADIIREYAENYPDIVKPFIETENQWSKKDGSLQRAVYNAVQSFHPKYVAICEGDDYWTDMNKLQKQVDILESDASLMGVYTDSSKVDDKSQLLESNLCGEREKSCNRQDLRYFFSKNPMFPTASVIWRNNHPEEIEQFFENTITKFVDDWNLWIAILIHGDFLYLDEVTVAYRIQPNSITHTNGRVERAKANREICLKVADNLPDKYKDIAEELHNLDWVWITLVMAYKAEKRYIGMIGCLCMTMLKCPHCLWDIVKKKIKK